MNIARVSAASECSWGRITACVLGPAGQPSLLPTGTVPERIAVGVRFPRDEHDRPGSVRASQFWWIRVQRSAALRRRSMVSSRRRICSSCVTFVSVVAWRAWAKPATAETMERRSAARSTPAL
jgi:hypothetical protein